MVFQEHVGDSWIDWKMNFPPLPGKVGKGPLPSVEDLFKDVFDFFIKRLEEHIKENEIKEKPGTHSFVDDHFGHFTQWLKDFIHKYISL